MSFDTAKNIIDKLLNNEFEFANIKNTFGLIVDFIGGEPFMEIDLIE
jgi:sulfatase maturation enzyme AslB (radical SAM superfamily)